MQIKGLYYPPRSSASMAAVLQPDDLGNCTLQTQGKALQFEPIAVLTISPRIGSSARTITFPDGGRFETPDNDAVDALTGKHNTDPFNRLTHFFESNVKAIVALIAVAIVSVTLISVYGLPVVARKSAEALPADVVQSIGEDALESLDSFILLPSELSEERRDEIEAQLQTLLPYADPEMNFTLEFRRLPGNIPNAFALPDGTMVLSDGLVDISTDDNQLIAVIAHEMGHVERRHHIRQTIESQGLFVMLVVVTGDIASFVNLAAAVPAAILNSSFSRNMETEADEYAARILLKAGIESHHLGDILELIEAFDSEGADEDDDSFTDYLRSHPKNKERLDNLQRFTEQAEKAL